MLIDSERNAMPQLLENITQIVQDWLKEDRNCWIAIAAAFLSRYEREIAIEKLSNALRHQPRDGPPFADTFGGRLFRARSLKIDYETIAIEIAAAAESAHPWLRQASHG